jgi:hypothetical protein
MAQSGYTPIQLYYSTTAAAVPVNTNLASGELALNIQDEKLYFKNAAGTVKLLASNATSAPVTSFQTSLSGLTPSTSTTGAVTLAGTLGTANGGTNLTSFTSGGVVYASSTSALATGSALTFDGTTLATTGKFGITGSGSIPTASALEIGTNGAGTRFRYNVPSGGEHNFTENGTVLSWQNLSSLGWLIGGSEQMRLTSTGLGIGTSSPSQKLTVNGSNAAVLITGTTNTSGMQLGVREDGQDVQILNQSSTGGIRLYTNSTQRVTITSAGDVGIGTSSPSASAKLTLAGTNTTASLLIYNNSQTVNTALIGTVSALLGTGTNNDLAIGVFGSQNIGFYTGGTSEKMRLDSAGNLGLGTSSPTAYTSRFIEVSNATSAGLKLTATSGNALGAAVEFVASDKSLRIGTYESTGFIRFGTQDTERARISAAGGFSVGTTADPGAGAIYATGNITAYYSDARLKTVSGKIENALDKVGKLSGVYYTNNETAKSFGYDSDEVQVGVLAQDVEAVLPQIVKAAPFDLDENNNSKSGENYKTVQYERLVPLLIEAINELRAEVKALKGE